MFNFYHKTLVPPIKSTCHSFGVEDAQNTTFAINIPLLAELRAAVRYRRLNEQRPYKVQVATRKIALDIRKTILHIPATRSVPALLPTFIRPPNPMR